MVPSNNVRFDFKSTYAPVLIHCTGFEKYVLNYLMFFCTEMAVHSSAGMLMGDMVKRQQCSGELATQNSILQELLENSFLFHFKFL